MEVSIISSFLGPEEEGIPRLARMGYRRVEANRRHKSTLPAPQLRAVCVQHGIEIHSLLGSDRQLVGPDAQVREERLATLIDNLDWACELGARIVEVAPIWAPTSDTRAQAWERAVGVLRAAAEEAGKRRLVLALEPVCRHQSDLVTTLAQAAQMVEAVGSDHLRIMADVHHTYIEESHPLRALSAVRDLLVHFHFSDNGRLPPGLGHLDLKALVGHLMDMGYDGSLSMSEIDPVPEAEAAARISFVYTSALLDACAARRRLS